MLMLLLAIPCALAGLMIVGWAVIRGEWTDRLPSHPEPHWRLSLGMLLLAGGGLVMVVAVALPRLAPAMTQSASEPASSSTPIERGSDFQELR